MQIGQPLYASPTVHNNLETLPRAKVGQAFRFPTQPDDFTHLFGREVQSAKDPVQGITAFNGSLELSFFTLPGPCLRPASRRGGRLGFGITARRRVQGSGVYHLLRYLAGTYRRLVLLAVPLLELPFGLVWNSGPKYTS